MDFPHSAYKKVKFNDNEVVFYVDDRLDPIQNFHDRGLFYEEIELKKLSQFIGFGKKVLDIGANVGNHAIFFAVVMKSSSVIVIEPDKRSYDILLKNVFANNLDSVDTNFLGIALGEQVSTVNLHQRYAGNLGSTTAVFDAGGSVPAMPADLFFQNAPIDFIKIDVEGAELKVLHGLDGTIKKNRPWIFIEIENENLESFLGWRDKNKYTIVWRHRRYAENENYLIRPVEHEGW